MLKGMYLICSVILFAVILAGCSEDSPTESQSNPLDPNTAPKVAVDRFSSDTGNLFVRDGANNFPGPNEPIDFDQAPFITQGFGPNGEIIKYYNFDVQPKETAPIFALFREGEDTPVEGQLNIIDVIPGEQGYNDFWHVHKVTVPADYVANTITSVQAVMDSGYPIEPTDMIVNCPVVPEGSTADLRFNSSESTGLDKGWYKDQVVFYFTFMEKAITVTPPAQGHSEMPVSDILVCFNINPGQQGGGPASGFMTEMNSMQTHNAAETIPTDAAYSPLWDVDVYDNADFNNVSDFASAQNQNILAQGVALVNCPIVSVQ
jgi:hypothetical protein